MMFEDTEKMIVKEMNINYFVICSHFRQCVYFIFFPSILGKKVSDPLLQYTWFDITTFKLQQETYAVLSLCSVIFFNIQTP